MEYTHCHPLPRTKPYISVKSFLVLFLGYLRSWRGAFNLGKLFPRRKYFGILVVAESCIAYTTVGLRCLRRWKCHVGIGKFSEIY
jgi:hypothetical protein